MLFAAVLLGMTTIAGAVLTDMGCCRFPVHTINFGYKEHCELARENDGVWSFAKAPEANEHVQRMLLATEKDLTGDSDFTTRMFYQDENDDCKLFIREQVFLLGHGAAIGKTIGGTTHVYKLFALDYKPGCYFYYYVCSDEGVDSCTDYRYVISQGKLTFADELRIANLEKKYKFKGALKNIF